MKRDYSLIASPVEGLAEERLIAIDELSSIVWPASPESLNIEIAPANERPNRYIASIEMDGKVVASAESFSRTIKFVNGSLVEIQALASVCTHPDYRKMGLASIVVKEIFKLVDNGRYPLSLWQTGVPDFYNKLGARTVNNRIINSLHPDYPSKKPFWDAFNMIYPADSDEWPEEGDVDIMGLGY